MFDRNKLIRTLQVVRFLLTYCQAFPPIRLLRDRIDVKKQALVNSVLDGVAADIGLADKYSNVDVGSLEPIGEKAWMFWYTGFDTAPPLVKKCAEIASKQPGIELTLLDKNNLEDYFQFEGNIRELFESGKITIQTFSDILRAQLLSRRGGFWLDATLFVTKGDFIQTYKGMPYYSTHHKHNELLLVRKMNEWFTKCRWSTYCFAAGKGNPIPGAMYDMWLAYYERHDTIFDYWQIDYIWLYLYERFDWAKALIDAVPSTVECIYWLHHRLTKPFSQAEWDRVLAENEILKLGWRAVSPEKLRKSDKLAGCRYYDHFLEYHP